LGRGIGKNSPFALVYVRGLRIGRGNRIIGRGRGGCSERRPAEFNVCIVTV